MLGGIWRGLTRRAVRTYRTANRVRARVSFSIPVSAPRARDTWTFSTALPDGYPAKRISIEVDLPPLPASLGFSFADHLTDEMGRPTDTIVANGFGALALSRDLGATWKVVPVRGYEQKDMKQLKALGPSTFLAQMGDGDEEKSERLDVVMLNEAGDVTAAVNAQGCRWHGCRAVARAGNTIMYAEYPQNAPVDGQRAASPRVFRSRDEGRSWQVVFERSGQQIRHFHFLQPRPGVPGEWWLTSGDDSHECRVWRSRDDGDSWSDLSAHVGAMIDIDGVTYQRRVFRLTDLIWQGDEVLWATDDILQTAADGHVGARVFRAKIGDRLEPHLIGRGHWHFRNLVDVGDFYVALSQGCPHPKNEPAKERPGVYLIPKVPAAGAPGMVHLFDVPTHSPKRTKLSASRASRAAKDGVFFSLRGRADFFPKGHRVLRWKLSFG